MHEDERTRALVDDAIGGDTVALKMLLTDSHARLCRYVARKLPPDVARVIDPVDIIQDAHIEVFSRICTFEPRGENSFYRWVASIALSRARNAIKRCRAAKRGGGRRDAGPRVRNVDDSSIALFDMLAGTGTTPSRSVARREAIDAVRAGLGDLPEHYRQAVWLVHIEGHSVREAAERMNRTERAIHGLCRRGLKLLREHLGRATKFLSSSE